MWTVRQYYTSSPYEFYAACEGFFDAKLQDAKLLRAIGYNIWMGSRTKKDQKIGVEEWLPFSGDKKESTKSWQPNKEQYDKMMDRYKIKRK